MACLWSIDASERLRYWSLQQVGNWKYHQNSRSFSSPTTNWTTRWNLNSDDRKVQAVNLHGICTCSSPCDGSGLWSAFFPQLLWSCSSSVTSWGPVSYVKLLLATSFLLPTHSSCCCIELVSKSQLLLISNSPHMNCKLFILCNKDLVICEV